MTPSGPTTPLRKLASPRKEAANRVRGARRFLPACLLDDPTFVENGDGIGERQGLFLINA